MLSDNERKLLRILCSLYGQGWVTPDLERLCRLSGRSEQQVKAAVKRLIVERYVEIKPGSLRVVEGWERQPPPPPRWVPMD